MLAHVGKAVRPRIDSESEVGISCVPEIGEGVRELQEKVYKNHGLTLFWFATCVKLSPKV